MSKERRPRWEDWVDRNAQPKPKYMMPSSPEQTTRWQKPGPKTRQQWIEFFEWARHKAAPLKRRVKKREPLQDATPPVYALQSESPFFMLYAKHKVENIIEKRKQHKEFIARMSEPKHYRDKYEPPPKKMHPYRPRLTGCPEPTPEIGRPTKKPVVPCCFQHLELEIDFWNNIRFPPSKNSQRAVASRAIIQLAKPRSYPPPPHCDLPEPCECLPKRTKMTPTQWRQHQRRLVYLSQPNNRVLADLSCNSIVTRDKPKWNRRFNCCPRNTQN